MRILQWMRDNRLKFLLPVVVVFESVNYLVA